MYSTGNFSIISEYNGKCFSSAKMALFMARPYLRRQKTHAINRRPGHPERKIREFAGNLANLHEIAVYSCVLLSKFQRNSSRNVQQGVTHAQNGTGENGWCGRHASKGLQGKDKMGTMSPVCEEVRKGIFSAAGPGFGAIGGIPSWETV
jgi:hypothetical protein